MVENEAEQRLLNLFRQLPKQEQRRLIEELEASQRQPNFEAARE